MYIVLEEYVRSTAVYNIVHSMLSIRYVRHSTQSIFHVVLLPCPGGSAPDLTAKDLVENVPEARAIFGIICCIVCVTIVYVCMYIYIYIYMLYTG